MLICKQPFVGGEVVPHQDSTFLATDPPSCIGIWLALEDATKDNGCLWTVPGSHVAGCHRRFVRAADGSVSFTGAPPPQCDDAAATAGTQLVPVEVKAGTLVVLHGANVHLRCVGVLGVGVGGRGRGASCRSGCSRRRTDIPSSACLCSKENTSPASRLAYSMHFVEGAPDVRWLPDNWLQREAALPFEPLALPPRTADATAAAAAVH